jgi:hypothetical protein
MLLLTAAFFAGCGQSDKMEVENVNDGGDALRIDPKSANESKVVARVNGVPIYEDELRGGRPVEYYITEEILYQKGLGMGLDDKYVEKIRDYKKQLIVHDIRTTILEDLPPTKEVSDEDIQNYYDMNPQKYTVVRMQEIAFVDKRLGDEILTRVKNGEDLTEIVNSYAESGANVVGRDLGHNRGLLNEFDTLELGSVSKVIEKPDNTYSVIKIVEIKPVPLQQTKRAIKHLLEAKRIKHAQDNYANKIAKENDIKIEIMNNN